VEHGRADWTADGIPARLLPEVRTRFASQVHRLYATETDFLHLNTTLPPFDDLRVREALNLAIDRGAIVRMFGGRTAATATCQILPPRVLGYRPYCPYTRAPHDGGDWSAPDLARARRLVSASGTRGDRVTVLGLKGGGVLSARVVPYTVRVLRRLGYRARALLFSGKYIDHQQRLFRVVQVGVPGWADPTPYGFFGLWLTCSAASNHHWFCDRRLDRAIRRADTVEATDTRAAAPLWTGIDHSLVDRAVSVPLVNPHWVDFVSRRVHNYRADPNLGLIADQVSLAR
jgi:peptide/nickel transport system substrate-binding protein